jgi:hypothetical protein
MVPTLIGYRLLGPLPQIQLRVQHHLDREPQPQPQLIYDLETELGDNRHAKIK